MISHKHSIFVAALALTAGCATTRAGTGGPMMSGPMMSGPMMMGGMAHGAAERDAMAHGAAAMPSFESMMQRADSLVRRTARMMGDTSAATSHAMTMEHAAGDPSQMMAGNLHAMAVGLRAFLQHMDAMHRADKQMDREAMSAMMELHQRSNTALGELEKTAEALDRMTKHHAKGGA